MLERAYKSFKTDCQLNQPNNVFKAVVVLLQNFQWKTAI